MVVPGATLLITYRLAFIEKLEQKFGKLTFGQVFLSGFLITIFTCILAVPVQLGFHKLINPDFFETMILHAAQSGKTSPEQALAFFNLRSYIIESTLYTFLFGVVLSLVFAFRMRTIK